MAKKGKFLPVLNEIPHHIEVLGVVMVQLYIFLTSALDGGEQLTSCK
jgi:hypothetical protein